MRLARAGALVRIVCAEDACAVCQSRAQRVYAPADVPRLPIRGCLHATCRCRFVAVDPETELTVPQLVERGARALRAGRPEIAIEILRRAVVLDDQYEWGWLWLSAVVPEREQIACLEKVLEINPHNQRAQAGIKALRAKLGAAQPAPAATAPQAPVPAPAAPVPAVPAAPESMGEPGAQAAPAVRKPGAEPAAAAEEPERPPAPIEVSPEVDEARQERAVIVEQWIDFIGIAVQTDPQMVLLQGSAFLNKLDSLSEQAFKLLPVPAHQDELRLQWQELDNMRRALLDVGEIHRGLRDETPTWEAMRQSLASLAQQLRERREAIRARFVATEG
jgi:hypothetical protein